MENKRKSITEIKSEFANADIHSVRHVMERYAEDDREGLNMRDSMRTVSISVELMR